METEQTIGREIDTGIQPVTDLEVRTEVVRDHTGARHVFEVYDAAKAERDAIAERGEAIWPNWHEQMSGTRPWTG